MKAFRFVLMALAVLALTLALGGCNIFINLFDGAPTVSLSVPSRTLYTGQSTTITANATDPHDYPLTYEWFENDVKAALDPSTTSVTYSKPVSSHTVVTIKVKVTNSKGVSGSAQVDLNLYPSSDGTLVVVNHTSDPVYYLYASTSGSQSWGVDRLGTTGMIPAGQSFTLYGLSVGSWDFKAETLGHASSLTLLSQWLGAGNVFTWNLY